MPRGRRPRSDSDRHNTELLRVGRVWLLGEIAAVDDELRAGDERGFVGGEEQHPVGDLDRLADPWAFSPRALTRGAAAAAPSWGRARWRWSRSASAGCSPDAPC